MFGPLGTPEILFIIVLALLIFGPRRLPELGRTVGRAMGEFRRATTELKRSVNTELALEEERPRPRRPAALDTAGGTVDPLPELRPDPGARPRPVGPRTPVGAAADGPGAADEVAELPPPPADGAPEPAAAAPAPPARPGGADEP